MSLYGTGRSEGIAAALLVGGLVVLARVLGVWLADGNDPFAALAMAWLPALGGMLCYRFLRAMGRSRYAAFLVGAAYGLSPWLTAIYTSPREQLAAALAPLALEAVSRCVRPGQRAAWLPTAWLCLAAPFVAGLTLVGCIASIVGVAWLLRDLVHGARDETPTTARDLLVVTTLAALAGANLVWLDPLAPWLGQADFSTASAVLSAHRPSHPGFDVAAVLRVPGPALLTFTLLGVLRRQRHVSTVVWGSLALVGSLPSLCSAWPPAASLLPVLTQHPQLPAAAWWLTLLGVAVMAAAGLDDFLDLPMRRRSSLPWLLAIAVAATPWLPAFGARDPDREWPLTAAFVGIAVALPAWRQLGILRFKNWLAALALVALAIPTLQIHAETLPESAAMPLGDMALPHLRAWAQLQARPLWHYAGLLVALGGGCVLALSAMRRNRHANKKPAAANAAITKKARPAQRS